ncbi:hypothetical protein MES5069_200096 [Mesorhizobium escarrei]|uniref:LysR substrate-binding domain-containing protein n=1 Tax=Mesorhizobium escarrei TaxID=666018 RepID=A0ABM9DPM3_9HYPH|nr:hypothetical protein MES5069_200096 [Mesorhizobium escarrei]
MFRTSKSRLSQGPTSEPSSLVRLSMKSSRMSRGSKMPVSSANSIRLQQVTNCRVKGAEGRLPIRDRVKLLSTIDLVVVQPAVHPDDNDASGRLLNAESALAMAAFPLVVSFPSFVNSAPSFPIAAVLKSSFRPSCILQEDCLLQERLASTNYVVKIHSVLPLSMLGDSLCASLAKV